MPPLPPTPQVAAGLGVHYDHLHVPLIMSALYGSRPPRLIVLLREPLERLHSAYWNYGHYHLKFGKCVCVKGGRSTCLHVCV